jgi:hypothetical protein
MAHLLSSGPVGLLIGAILGLGLAVVFEDYLKERWARLVRRVRLLRHHGGSPKFDEYFRVGDLETSLVLVEGDGTQVINEHAVTVILDPVRVTLPAELEKWRQELIDTQSAAIAEGRHHFWNGLSYAVADFSVSRHGIDESPAVALRLKEADYFTFLATQQLDRPFEDGGTPRSRYVQPFEPRRVPDFMCPSFGAYVAVITADNLAVFCKRSSDVGAFPMHWDGSANEALSRSLDSNGRTPPNLYDVARRGLFEEMGLERNEYRLEMLAFVFDRGTCQWGCAFAAFLHDLTGAELMSRHTRGVPDRFEHEERELVRFKVKPIIEHLLRADRRDNWTPVAPALYYLALVRQYGRVHTERLVRRVAARMSGRKLRDRLRDLLRAPHQSRR